jgi:prevent-host-death family protein
VDVAVSALRAQLSDWIERVRSGEEVIVTDRGTPVARILAVGSAPDIERLIAEGVIARPAAAQRPRASGRRRVAATRPVSDHVIRQRD